MLGACPLKFMGSKRRMLGDGLGELLDRELHNAGRFVDMFSGSGAVAHWVAERTAISVHASDTQSFARSLAAAVVCRTEAVDASVIWERWASAADAVAGELGSIASPEDDVPKWVERDRRLASRPESTTIAKAYGGYYFSYMQARTLDELLRTRPTEVQDLTTAALIVAASECAAAPGHTAQPFKPTSSAAPHISASWHRDVLLTTERALVNLAPRHARVMGVASVKNAAAAAADLSDGDLVFVDPPYSAVQYSRFYHVLESIALGRVGPVSGAGRYPDRNLRPQSMFSMKSRSLSAVRELAKAIGQRDVTVIITFPQAVTSNGLSADQLVAAFADDFVVTTRCVESKMSTMGGRAGDRGGRKAAVEVISVLKPRRTPGAIMPHARRTRPKVS